MLATALHPGQTKSAQTPFGNPVGDVRAAAERNVLRGLAQNPMGLWPQCCTLRNSDFRYRRDLWILCRSVIETHLSQGYVVPALTRIQWNHFLPDLNAFREERGYRPLQVDPADLVELDETFHPMRFVEGLNIVRGAGSFTAEQLDKRDSVKRLCNAIELGRYASTGVEVSL